MLAYLKDGQKEVPAAQDMPSGTEGTLSKQEDYLTVSGHNQKLRQSTILLIVVFGIGALGVWFMIKKATPSKAATPPSQEQAQLENAIAQLNSMQTEMNSQMDSVVGRFYQSSSIGQISVDELKKNPFKREMGFDMSEMDDAQRQDRVMRLSSGLQLWSVTTTPRGMCCMVNDKVLYIGDTINELTVKSIDEKTVVLEKDGIITKLKME